MIPDWLTLTQTSGNAGTTVIAVTVNEANNRGLERMSLLEFTNSFNTNTAIVIQRTNVTIAVTPEIVFSPHSGGTYTLTVSSSTDWIATYPTWVSGPTSGSAGSIDISITVSRYTSLTNERRGYIVFNNNASTFIVEVIQSRLVPSLTVTPLSIAMAQQSGITYNLTVSSNTDWIITYPSWVKCSLDGTNPITGATGNQTVLVKPDFNNSEDSRSGVITVAVADYSITQTVTVTQSGGEIVYSLMPLTFEILSSGNIIWKKIGDMNERTIQYSINNSNWLSITSTNNGTVLNVKTGDIIRLRGNNLRYNDGNINNWTSFSGSSAQFKAYGNIMSLIDATNFDKITTISSSNTGTFQCLFRDCTGLLYADNLILPATSLSVRCYYGMFWSCGNLIRSPKILPALSLETANLNPGASECYGGMFRNCTSLTTAPELPATILSYECYYRMFEGCTSLTTAPELPATPTLSNYLCYGYMFRNCSNLNYIKCLATRISTVGNNTANWVQGVSSTGTFVKDASMTEWPTGDDGIPNNWIIQNV